MSDFDEHDDDDYRDAAERAEMAIDDAKSRIAELERIVREQQDELIGMRRMRDVANNIIQARGETIATLHERVDAREHEIVNMRDAAVSASAVAEQAIRRLENQEPVLKAARNAIAQRGTMGEVIAQANLKTAVEAYNAKEPS